MRTVALYPAQPAVEGTAIEDVLPLRASGTPGKWCAQRVRRHVDPDEMVLAENLTFRDDDVVFLGLVLAAVFGFALGFPCFLGALKAHEGFLFALAYGVGGVLFGGMLVLGAVGGSRHSNENARECFVIVTDRRVLVLRGGPFHPTKTELPRSALDHVLLEQRPSGYIRGKTHTLKLTSFVLTLHSGGAAEPAEQVLTGLNPRWIETLREQREVPIATGGVGSRAALALAFRLLPRGRSELSVEWWAEVQAGDAAGWCASARRRFAWGLVLAALTFHRQEGTDRVWRRVDHVALSEKRTRRFVAVVMLALVLYLMAVGGLIEVITNAENLAVIGGGLYGLARWRRKLMRE